MVICLYIKNGIKTAKKQITYFYFFDRKILLICCEGWWAGELGCLTKIKKRLKRIVPFEALCCLN